MKAFATPLIDHRHAEVHRKAAPEESRRLTHILVVDDENGPRQALRMLLKEEYTIHLAEDVPSALEVLSSVPVELVITDVRMPRQNGVDLLRATKERYPDVQVIMLTGYGELNTAVKAVEFDAFAYLEKPFDNNAMLSLVANAIGRSQTERSRRELEFLALEANRFETLGRVISGSLHDMGGPLTVLSAQLELIGQKPRTPDWTKRLDNMRTQVRHCNEIVISTMNFLRSGPVTMDRFDLNMALESCLEVVAPQLRASSVQVVTRLDEDLPKPWGDVVLVRQAILNLVTNACQAMELDSECRTLLISSWLDGASALLSIEDTGPGIPEKLHDRVFDTFFSTKGSAGTGLGLSVVKQVMDRMNGDVCLADGTGTGACFRLRFPLSRD